MFRSSISDTPAESEEHEETCEHGATVMFDGFEEKEKDLEDIENEVQQSVECPGLTEEKPEDKSKDEEMENESETVQNPVSEHKDTDNERCHDLRNAKVREDDILKSDVDAGAVEADAVSGLGKSPVPLVLGGESLDAPSFERTF